MHFKYFKFVVYLINQNHVFWIV